MAKKKPEADTQSLILKNSIRLFAEQGYEGVSMRNIAEAVDISAPGLYNHFKDKQSLYLAAISDSFENKSDLLKQAVSGDEKPIVRLERYVVCLSGIFNADPDFRRLMQRELLDGDEKRLHQLAKDVFSSSFQSIMNLLTEIKPDCDAHILTVIIVGMIQKPFEMNPLDRFFTGSKKKHNNPEYVTRHVMAILSAYLGATV